MEQNHHRDHNPWVPESGVQLVAPPGTFRARLNARLTAGLCRSPELSWGLPLVALAFYVVCNTFFDEIAILGWGMHNQNLPDYDRFMSVVTSISGIFWGLGGGMQILLIENRRKIPGVYRHLLPALAISAYCAVGFMSQFDRTSTLIHEYSNGNDSRSEPDTLHRSPVKSTPPLLVP
jgi:hypothetical protein